MLGWCIETLASARLKASVRFSPLRGMYQRGGTCKGCDNRAIRHVIDLKAALHSALHHRIRRELTEEQATTYQLRHEIERYHHDVVARAQQLEEFEAELQKKLPMEKEL